MKKPPRLVATCIVALVLATLFVCSDLSQLGSQLWTAWAQTQQMGAFANMPADAPGARGAESMMRETMALQTAMRPVLVALSSIDLLIAFLMIGSAAMTLALSPTGKRLFMGVLLAAMAWDTAGVLVNQYVAWKAKQLMQHYMSQMMSDVPPASGGGPDIGSMMSTWMGASTAIGLVCAGGWLALKISFYVSSVIYLRRAETAALFARTDEHGAARAAGMPRG